MEKLDCKSLMIGDWVLYDNEPHRIEEILYGEVMIERWPKDSDEIEPIPITKEILKKNGFKPLLFWDSRINTGVKCLCLDIKPWTIRVLMFKDSDEMMLEIYKGCTYALNKCPFEYVHQLQHAMRLWGIEKEIEV